jgi:hypothetical protein
VAEHQDLDILGSRGPSEQIQPAEQPHHDQVRQSKQHGRRASHAPRTDKQQVSEPRSSCGTVQALRHYQLAWRDIIAHAVLQAPAKRYKRARVHHGPWRYSKYDVRLFLITQDGVREVSTELDFEHVEFNGQERNNFRFDAVSSVHVVETSELSYTLELTLTNGPVQNIRIVDPNDQQPDPGENSRTFSRINLDTAGFAHALHILEGIAAEGRNWIDRIPSVSTDNTLAQ